MSNGDIDHGEIVGTGTVVLVKTMTAPGIAIFRVNFKLRPVVIRFAAAIVLSLTTRTDPSRAGEFFPADQGMPAAQGIAPVVSELRPGVAHDHGITDQQLDSL